MVNPVSLRPREQPADPRQRLRFSLSRWRVDLLALLGFLGLSVLLFAESWRAPATSVAGAGTEDIGIIVALLITLYPQRLRPHRPHALAALGVAAAVFLTLAAVPIGFQFFGPQHVTGAVQIRNAYVSDLLGFVVPTARQQFAPAAAVRLSQGFSGYSSEWDAYLGVPLIGLLVYVSVRFWTRPLVRVAATLMLMLAVLSLGTTLHIAGQWTAVPVGALALMAPLLRRVIPVRFGLYVFPATWVGLAAAPILSSALPARLMLYVFLFAGLLVAVAADAWLAAPTVSSTASAGGLSKLFKALVIGAALLPLIPRLPFPAEPVEVPRFFTGGGVKQLPQGSVALVLPYARLANSSAMFWQAAADMRFRMPEAYALLPGPSFSSPPTQTSNLMRMIEQGEEPPALSDDLRGQVLRDLGAWKVEAIIVGPMPYRERMIAFFTWLMGTPPRQDGGVYIWRRAAWASASSRLVAAPVRSPASWLIASWSSGSTWSTTISGRPATALTIVPTSWSAVMT